VPTGMTELKRRIASARQMRKVASAMQQVASARLSRLRRDAENASAHTQRLRDLLAALGESVSGIDHPLLEPGRGAVQYALVFGSDRGLCGGFNRVLMDAVARFKDSVPDREVALLVVGKLVARRVAKRGMRVEASFEQPRDPGGLDGLLHQLAGLATDAFIQDRAAEVHVIHANFSTGQRGQPVVRRVLPVPFGEGGKEAHPSPDLRVAVFEPDANAVVSRLLKESVFLTLRDAFLNSCAAENAARQESMGGAADNADKLLTEMMMTYRRLRQESITTQIIEVAGALRYGA